MRIKKSSELLWLLGNIFVALGVSLCSKADLGVSMIAAPAFIISEALSPFFSFLSVGVTEYLIQGVLLVILFLIIRKFDWRFLFAFAVAIVYGYILNAFLWMLSYLPITSIWQRWITLIIGDAITAFGVACFFHTYMPLQVYELFVAQISKKFNLNINKCKWIFDISLLFISIALSIILFNDFSTFNWSKITYSSFHSIGLGTIVTTIINSPIIGIMSKIIERFFDNSARFKSFKAFLKN